MDAFCGLGSKPIKSCAAMSYARPIPDVVDAVGSVRDAPTPDISGATVGTLCADLGDAAPAAAIAGQSLARSAGLG